MLLRGWPIFSPISQQLNTNDGRCSISCMHQKIYFLSGADIECKILTVSYILNIKDFVMKFTERGNSSFGALI